MAINEMPMQHMSPDSSSLKESERVCMMIQLTLRIMVILLTSIAGYFMINSDQRVTVFENVEMYASYTSSSACKFALLADVIVCACSLLSLTFVCFLTSPKSNPRNYFYLIVYDLVMVVLMVSGCVAGSSIGYIAKYGQRISGWTPICDQFSKFCSKVTMSLAFSYIAFFCLFLLSLLSANRLKLYVDSN